MPKQVQFRRGTTTQHATFTGAVGEVTVDTTKKVSVVHDGVTAGGTPSAKESVVTTLQGRLDAFGTVPRVSDAAIAQFAIVKIGSDASHVTTAGAADVPVGIALNATGGAGEAVTMALLTSGFESPRKMISSAAVTLGSLVEPAASGKVATLGGSIGTHHVIGRALAAAGAADILIDVAPCYFLRVI